MTNYPSRRRGRPKKLGGSNYTNADYFFQTLANLAFSDRERMVLEGISVKYVTDLALMLRIDLAFMEKLLLLDSGLLATMKEDDLFGTLVSDRVMAVLELYCYGVQILGEFELFNEWMKKPSENFIFHRPIDLIVTHSGLLEVRQMLAEIKTGYY